MHQNASGYLDELRRLAGRVFDVVRAEFTPGGPLVLEFDSVNDLAEAEVESEHLIATTLLCAQLLHRVTADPEQAHPRHVNTLSDIIEQVIPPLIADIPTDPSVAKELLDMAAAIADVAFRLVLLSDPGSNNYGAE